MATEDQTYQLLIEIAAEVHVRIGKLGEFSFPPGRYIYTGSAKKNLEARIRRHLSTFKRMHWHIDYLLAAEGVRVVRVLRFTEEECRKNQSVPGEVLIPGFGSSDCHASCGSHLKKVGSATWNDQS